MVQVDYKKYSPLNKSNDTGSPECQIAILTKVIIRLTEHINKNKHDYTSKLSLQKAVNKRRKILKYLKKKSTERFNKIMLMIKNKEIK